MDDLLILELLPFTMWYTALNGRLFHFILIYWTFQASDAHFLSELTSAAQEVTVCPAGRGNLLRHHNESWQKPWIIMPTYHPCFIFWNGLEAFSQHSIAKMLPSRWICYSKVKLLVCTTGEGDLKWTAFSWKSDRIPLFQDTRDLQLRKSQRVVLWWRSELSTEIVFLWHAWNIVQNGTDSVLQYVVVNSIQRQIENQEVRNTGGLEILFVTKTMHESSSKFYIWSYQSV